LTLVHPHACGDIFSLQIIYHKFARFTPTRVGTSFCRCVASVAVAVHPHACGDISRALRRAVLCAGSPPRVWGHLGSN